MSAATRKSASSSSPRRHTSEILEMLRGRSLPNTKAAPPTSVPSKHAGPPLRRRSATAPSVKETAETPTTDNLIPSSATQAPQLRLISERLRRSQGRLGRLLSHADELAQVNRVMHAFLPAHLRDYANLVACHPEAWIIHTESAAWATRLRYVLPTLRQQLADHLQCEVPKLRLRIRPKHTASERIASIRRMTVSDQTVEVLEGAADGVNDTRLSSAMKRLAQHARQRVA